MGFLAFVKLAFICFDALAWPLFALGYPLRASIQAIEADSNSDMKKLVTYWVIFSLISLFERAFMVLLQRLPFWPYMKLTIVCCMVIPNFDGALYVYNHFVHPCLHLDVQTIVNWFKKQQEFSRKDNFLAQADTYVKVHGPEPLEKLIASESKGTEPGVLALQKDIQPVQVTEKMEVVPVNLIRETEPNAAQTVNSVITAPEINGAAAFAPPEMPTDKQVQKEWTCAMCQVTTTSEKTLNSHLQGRRHIKACEELMKAKNQPSKGKETLPQKRASSTTNQASRKKQQPSKGQVSAASEAKNSDPSNNTSTSSKAVNAKTGTSKSNLPEDEPKKSPPNNMAGNQLKPSEKAQGQQQVAKKRAETEISQFCCTICNINCCRSEDLNCHLLGRKHLARIKELNSLGRTKLA